MESIVDTHNPGLLENFISEGYKVPFCLSVAGLDPSGGAGLLSDIKSFEAQGVYGLAVMTCNTLQTDQEIKSVNWQPEEVILSSIELLASRYKIRCVKIGALKDLCMLQAVLRQIKKTCPNALVIWDPIMKASVGNSLLYLSLEDLRGVHAKDWKTVLSCIDLVTPNSIEASQLSVLTGLNKYGSEVAELNLLDPHMRLLCMETGTAILLKGGHLEDTEVVDRLYMPTKGEAEASSVQCYLFKGEPSLRSLPKDKAEKHGSGCVHSSTIAALLAKGYALEVAASMAKHYMNSYLHRSVGRLAMHAAIHETLYTNVENDKTILIK